MDPEEVFDLFEVILWRAYWPLFFSSPSKRPSEVLVSFSLCLVITLDLSYKTTNTMNSSLAGNMIEKTSLAGNMIEKIQSYTIIYAILVAVIQRKLIQTFKMFKNHQYNCGAVVIVW
jgi:hypothetical protein